MDVIGDALNVIRMIYRRKNRCGELRANKVVLRIVQILKNWCFIEGYITQIQKGQLFIKVFIKYNNLSDGVYPDMQASIRGIKRVSKLSRRVFVKSKQLLRYNKHGEIAIISTNKGILSSIEAVRKGVGGEVLCVVW